MKAKLTVELDSYHAPESEQGKRAFTLPKGASAEQKGKFWVYPEETVIEHPDVYRLVQNGCAVPVDDECKKKCAMDADKINAARAAYQKLINHPDAMSASEQKNTLKRLNK